jgi:hypothetical protein
MTGLIGRPYVPSETFLTFVGKGARTQYLPKSTFNVAPFAISRRMDAFTQHTLRKGRTEEQHAAREGTFQQDRSLSVGLVSRYSGALLASELGHYTGN